MDESRIGQYSISVTTYPIMALLTGGPLDMRIRVMRILDMRLFKRFP